MPSIHNYVADGRNSTPVSVDAQGTQRGCRNPLIPETPKVPIPGRNTAEGNRVHPI